MKMPFIATLAFPTLLVPGYKEKTTKRKGTVAILPKGELGPEENFTGKAGILVWIK